MTVKELRQGLRRGLFVYPFIGIHVLAVVAMAAEFQQLAEVEKATEHTGILNLYLFLPGSMFSGWFWFVTAAVCLVFMPMGGLALMGQELEEGNHELLLMTPLSRWKVVRGKFLALWGLCLLTFSSLLPYVIVRYFIGGIDVGRNVAMAVTVVLFSGVMAAGGIGASSFTGIGGRIGTLLLFLGSLLLSLLTTMGLIGKIIEEQDYPSVLSSILWNFNALAVVFCYTVFGLALARSRIRLVVHHYEVKPSWMIIGLLFFTPFVVGMATLMTLGHAGGIGLIGMGLVGWFADVSPKAPKWVEAPAANIPGVPPQAAGGVPLPPGPPASAASANAPPPLPSSPAPEATRTPANDSGSSPEDEDSAREPER